MGQRMVEEFRKNNNNITVSNFDEKSTSPLLNPCATFHHAFHQYPDIMETINRQGFFKVIQIPYLPGNALGIWICGCRCILESSGSQNSGCTQYQKPQNQPVQKMMSQISAGLCTRCTLANAFHGLIEGEQKKSGQTFSSLEAISQATYSASRR